MPLHHFTSTIFGQMQEAVGIDAICLINKWLNDTDFLDITIVYPDADDCLQSALFSYINNIFFYSPPPRFIPRVAWVSI